MKQIMTIATFIYLGRFHNGFMRNKKRSVYPAALHIALVAGEAFWGQDTEPQCLHERDLTRTASALNVPWAYSTWEEPSPLADCLCTSFWACSRPWLFGKEVSQSRCTHQTLPASACKLSWTWEIRLGTSTKGLIVLIGCRRQLKIVKTALSRTKAGLQIVHLISAVDYPWCHRCSLTGNNHS